MIRLGTTAVEIVFSQLTKPVEEIAIKLVKERMHNVIPNAMVGAGYVFGAVASRTPDLRLQHFLPVVLEKIELELKQGASSLPTSSPLLPFGMATMSDSTLHWYQEIFIRILRKTGYALFPYRERLESLLDFSLQRCNSKAGYTRAHTAIQAIFESLLSIYPTNESSHELKEWDNNLGSSNWGETTGLDSLTLEWHLPSPKEIEFGLALLEKYLKLAIDELKIAMEKKGKLVKWLGLLGICLVASEDLLMPSDAISESAFDCHSYPLKNLPVIEAGWILRNHSSDPIYLKWKRLIDEAHQFLFVLGKHMLHHSCDDTDSLAAFCPVAMMAFPISGAFDFPTFYLDQSLPFLNLKGDKKCLPRHIRMLQAHKLHLQRQSHARSQPVLSVNQKCLIQILIEFSLNKYSAVRKNAQTILVAFASKKRSVLYQVLVDMLQRLELLPLNSDDDHVIKGALYTMIQFRNKFNFPLYQPELRFLVFKVLIKWLSSPYPLKESTMTLLKANSEVLGLSLAIGNQFYPSQRIVEYLQGTEALVNLQSFKTIYKELCMRWKLECVSIIIHLPKDRNQTLEYIAGKFLVDLIASRDLPIQESFAEQALSNLCSPVSDMRSLGKYLLKQIFKTLRTRSKSFGFYHFSTLKQKAQKGSEMYELIKKSKYDWSDGFYCDELNKSWLIWPQEFIFYRATGMPTLPFAYSDPFSVSGLNAMRRILHSDQFWSSYCEAMATEPKNDDVLEIDPFETAIIAEIFQLFFDGPLHFVIPQLASLVERQDETHCQTAAAQLISGIICGYKHWDPDLILETNQKLIPLLQYAFENCSSDSMPIWIQFWDDLLFSRDASRFQEILEYFMTKELIQETSSFLEQCRDISFFNDALSTVNVPLKFKAELCSTLISILNSPYGQVRVVLGSCLDHGLRSFSALCFESFVEFSAQQNAENFEVNRFLQMVNMVPYETYNREEKICFCRTIINWYLHSLTTWSAYPGTKRILPQMLLQVDLAKQLGDPDLFGDLDMLLRHLSRYHLNGDDLPIILDQICTFSQAADQIWHNKIRYLKAIQQFYFGNLFNLTDSQKTKIISVVVEMVNDSSTEVRLLASKTFSGLVRLSPLNLIRSYSVRDHDFMIGRIS
jgi:proteasome activator subunit 4